MTIKLRSENKRNINYFYSCAIILLLVSVPQAVVAASIPAASDWTEKGVVLSGGNTGSWDVFLGGVISPSAVIKKNGTFFLYYVGADGFRSTDGGPRYRAMGVATSTDGINFVKYSGNPILKYLPNNNEEEGLFSAGAMIDDNGDILLYYSGCESDSATSQLVSCHGLLATSTNGLDFTEQGIVLDYSDGAVWGSGDELFPVGAFKANNKYHLYYIAKGTGISWQLGLATGSSRNNFTSTQAVITSGDKVVGGVNPVFLSPTQIALFVVRGFTNWYTDIRIISPDTPEIMGSNIAVYDLDNVYHTTHFYDKDTDKWFMYYLEGGEIIRLKIATGTSAASDNLAPSPPRSFQ